MQHRRMMKRISADSPSLFDLSSRPSLHFEDQAKGEGFHLIAGADEAGRGPLAGPVVAAAVILNPNDIPAGLNDSKKLTAKKRLALFDEILSKADVAVASESAVTIDRTDVRKASLAAMRKALFLLPNKPDYALIDGRDVPAGLHCPAKAVIKGDALSLSIAAASIVAKVTRDRMMEHVATVYPGYGFEKHAGYGTADHRAAIETLGACPIHRMSFRPLRKD